MYKLNIEAVEASAARTAFVLAWADAEEREGRTYPGERLDDIAPSQVPGRFRAWARDMLSAALGATRTGDGIREAWARTEPEDLGRALALSCGGWTDGLGEQDLPEPVGLPHLDADGRLWVDPADYRADAPSDEDPDEGETCPECERDLGADYTEGCEGCADEREEKRETDLARELAEVRRELATALDAREDARAQLADARTADPYERDPGPATEAEGRADILSERVRELESRAVELETALAAGAKLARLRPGTFAIFTPDATVKGLKLLERSGARVRIVRALGFADADLDETGPMYRIEFDDEADTNALLDELEPLD